ncbi:MAG: ABC transporter ATP-binding protein, partial [Elusimicrobiota bacterium]
YDLNPGETLGIVGESGCGKSVHAMSILRLIPNPPGKIVGGEILFQGKEMKEPVDLTRIPEQKIRRLRGNRIAMIFQEPVTSLNPVLTVGEQIAEVIRHHEGAGFEEAEKRATGLLERVGIANAAKRIHDYPHSFSGGMRQRAMIAMALAMKPDILIADEPTTALDVTVQAQILKLIRDMQNDYNMAVILITHNMGVVAEIANKVIVMYAGRPAETAEVKQIFSHPRHPYTWGLLNSIPKLNQRSEKLIPIEGQPPNLSHNDPGCLFAPRCLYAWADCRLMAPTLLETEKTQMASCWLHDPEKRRQAPASQVQEARKNGLL